MAVNRKLNKRYESISKEIPPFKEMFLGDVFGVVLRQRGRNDPHVVFQIIHEDDGYWFLSTNSVSSSWFEDCEEVLRVARKWCEKNCIPYINNGIQYGWKFK